MLALSNQIADYLSQTLGLTLTAPMQLALADHIQFAVERLAAGQRIQHTMLWELKSSYRAEFTAALHILEMVRQATGVVLPVDEAGFITMHLVNASLSGNMASSVATATTVQHIVELVRERIATPLAPDSVVYARFLTHLKFAVARIEEGSLLEGSDNQLYRLVRDQDPQAHECALAIADFIREEYQVQLPEEELLYLMLHINRLRSREAASAS